MSQLHGIQDRGWRGAGFVEAIHALYAGDPAGGVEQASDMPTDRREAFRASPCWPSRDLAVLWDLLSHLEAAAEIPQKPVERCEILDLACGRCSEAVLLGAWAARRIQALQPGCIRLYGVDIRELELDKARQRCEATQGFFQGFSRQQAPAFVPSFRYGDATSLVEFKEMPLKVDLVFLRHQNGWHNVKIWTEIFNQGLSRLAPGGLLIITSYFDREHAMALNMISGLGGELLASLRNPQSRELSTVGKSVDRHAAVFRHRGLV